MDISNLTALVTVLRAETAYAAITPESLGSLLQKIVDVIAGASSDNELHNIKNWSEAIKTANVITNITQTSADSNNVKLDMDSVALANGNAVHSANAITIQQATTERAGVMAAQQVIDLNTAKSNIATLSEAIEKIVSGVKIDKYKSYAFANGMWSPVGNASSDSYLHVFFKNNTSVSTVVPNSAGSSGSSGSSGESAPAYRIVTDCKGGELHVENASVFTDMGYVPYIFRYTVKTNRLRDKVTHQRCRGPKRRGWHVFYGVDTAKVSGTSLIVFGQFIGGHLQDFYSADPYNMLKVTAYEDDYGDITELIVGFGSKSINAVNGHSFKFGIAFGPYMKKGEFQMSRLVTNIAPFRVHVRLGYSGKGEAGFAL